VIAIEPDPANFRLLERNVRLNALPNVELLSFAMTASPRELLLSAAAPSNTGTSSVRIDDGSSSGLEASREIRVAGETLDRIVRSRGLTRIDWLKIDVEGHEVAVLEGGRFTLGITQRLILEVTDQSERACREIVQASGFQLIAVEQGDPASNWLLVRPSGNPRSS
jgi:FkbM family methyltransferase